jgi:hypothetical protein
LATLEAPRAALLIKTNRIESTPGEQTVLTGREL